MLNDKLSKLSKSEIGQFVGEFYQVSHSTNVTDSNYNMSGSTIEEMHDYSKRGNQRGKRFVCVQTHTNHASLITLTGDVLLQKLAQIWSVFYTSILPTLQAFFATVQV